MTRRSTIAVVVAAAAAVGGAGAACAPPAAGAPLQSLDCSTAGATLAFAFAVTNVYSGQGQISVAGTQLCVAVRGTIASDGAPAVALAPCASPPPADQRFTPTLGGTMLSGLTGACLDLVSGVQAPNELVELFGCNGGANQNIVFNATTGRITVPQWGYCIGTC